MYCKYSLPFKDQLLNHNGLTEVPDYVVDSEGSFVSMNPKTMDPIRNIRTKLDRPSTTGSVPLCRVYDSPHLDNYTPHNVNNGQITYFIDRSIKDAFYDPVYQIPYQTYRYAYTDPMGSEKPHYALVHRNADVFQYTRLSSMNDASFHRENLTASQQAKFNQTRITPFY
jgi:hypothetical protein